MSLFEREDDRLIINKSLFQEPKCLLYNHKFFQLRVQEKHTMEFHKKFIFFHFDNLHSIHNRKALPSYNTLQHFMALYLDELYFSHEVPSYLHKYL
jgi:hypothetical protein